ncbi:MAG: DNA double-strand break repair nuclease NurA [Anaerolineales bacterium]|nr:MAG: DNA double-strand break repair nuclease NurA [Anaerolineales bacterium]
MLVRSRVVAALEAKKDHFASYQVELRDTLGRFWAALESLPSFSRAEIEAKFSEAEIVWPGALPTSEQDRLHDTVIGAGQSWANHEDARAWAKEVLLNIPTFAVDGSQIPPSRDFSVPVGAVQVGWFENPHVPGGQYVKDLVFEVLAPDELAEEAEGDVGGDFPDWRVNLRRFEMECQAVIEYMEAHAADGPGSPRSKKDGPDTAPLCFFDGSLVVSFAQHMRPNLRRRYVDAVTGMLRASQACRVPLVGYVDTSFARDLVMMLINLCQLPYAPRMSDGALLRPRMGWGDRSQVYICARDDKVLPEYGPHARQVCFCYLKTTAEGAPARLEFPGWLAEDEVEMERTLNLVRAECIVGNGYPYALETADAVAVIGLRDRERFYTAFQRFAQKQGLALRYSRKALSKRMRR